MSSEPLEIRDGQDKLVMCLLPNMPQDMKSSLLGNLAACFDLEPSNLQTMFSGELKENYTFEALHFSYYNRHCTRVRPLSLSQQLFAEPLHLYRGMMYQKMRTPTRLCEQTVRVPTTARCCRICRWTLEFTRMSMTMWVIYLDKFSNGLQTK